MSLVEHAKRELKLLNKDIDCLQNTMNKDILEIVETFAEQGHSGASAHYALEALKKLVAYKPLTPLTGEEDEWRETSGSNTQQNKRRSSVFRANYDNATAYDMNGIIFSDDGGKSWYTSIASIVPITFPYTVPEEPRWIIRNQEGSKE